MKKSLLALNLLVSVGLQSAESSKLKGVTFIIPSDLVLEEAEFSLLSDDNLVLDPAKTDKLGPQVSICTYSETSVNGMTSIFARDEWQAHKFFSVKHQFYSHMPIQFFIRKSKGLPLDGDINKGTIRLVAEGERVSFKYIEYEKMEFNLEESCAEYSGEKKEFDIFFDCKQQGVHYYRARNFDEMLFELLPDHWRARVSVDQVKTFEIYRKSPEKLANLINKLKLLPKKKLD